MTYSLNDAVQFRHWDTLRQGRVIEVSEDGESALVLTDDFVELRIMVGKAACQGHGRPAQKIGVYRKGWLGWTFVPEEGV